MSKVVDHKIETQSDVPKAVLIFFHGYGSTGAEMANYVGGYLKNKLPDVTMRFPDGILPSAHDERARSWFDITDMLRDKEQYGKPYDGNLVPGKVARILPIIHNYIDYVMREENVQADQIIMAGFSQGGTVSFYTAMQREQQIGGVFSVSAPAIDQVFNIRSKPPVKLLAGADEHSYFSGRQLAEKTHALLQIFNFESSLYLTPENGHDMDENSLKALADFVADIACKQPASNPDRNLLPR